MISKADSKSVDGFISREDTKWVKGIAIILMLLHHLWAFPVGWRDQAPGTPTVCMTIIGSARTGSRGSCSAHARSMMATALSSSSSASTFGRSGSTWTLC